MGGVDWMRLLGLWCTTLSVAFVWPQVARVGLRQTGEEPDAAERHPAGDREVTHGGEHAGCRRARSATPTIPFMFGWKPVSRTPLTASATMSRRLLFPL